MLPHSVRNLIGSPARRLALGAALGLGAIAGPAEARPIRVCYMGDFISIWVEFDFVDALGNYDPVALTGVIDFNTSGSQNADDFVFAYADNNGDLRVLTGPIDSAMGTYDVQGGLGTGACTVSFPNLWVTIGGYGIHLIFDAANPLAATMPLVGFTGEGSGVYMAEGLAIPMQFEVHQPDGTTVIASDVCRTLEFRSPLDLSPPCAADCDGNGLLNVDDIDCFVQSFLGGCAL